MDRPAKTHRADRRAKARRRTECFEDATASFSKTQTAHPHSMLSLARWSTRPRSPRSRRHSLSCGSTRTHTSSCHHARLRRSVRRLAPRSCPDGAATISTAMLQYAVSASKLALPRLAHVAHSRGMRKRTRHPAHPSWNPEVTQPCNANLQAPTSSSSK